MCLTFLSVDHFFTSPTGQALKPIKMRISIQEPPESISIHSFLCPFRTVLCKRVWSGGSSDKWLNAKRLHDHIATPVLQAAQNAADAAGAYPF